VTDDQQPGEQEPEGHEAGPATVARRRVLIGLGLGAASLGMLRRLPTGRTATPPSSAGPHPTTTTSTPPGTTSTTTPGRPVPSVPPVLDDSLAVADDGHVHDVVISGGRVIDPDSHFDAVAHVGIDGDTITRISLEPLTGTTTVDAAGLVVSPGFIDILSYPPNGYGEWFKVADGVTTNLCLHGIDATMEDFLARGTRNDPPVNYGGATDQYEHRKMLGAGIGFATEAQIVELAARAEADLLAGAVGIHEQPEYVIGVTFEEMLAHGAVAARHNVPLCLHLRHSRPDPPSLQEEGIDEAIRVARETGCRIHIEHINSTGGTGRMVEAIAQVDAARAEGLSITACVYPYTFWATNAGSARFDDFQAKYEIGYGDLQVANTPDRLTEATFRRARADNLLTAAFAMSEEDITDALAAPWVMLGSDAILTISHNNHPRSTGCFSRLLGVYVRERGVLDLPDALGRMTILPARLLEDVSPAMARRGRIQAGAVADVTVFDPATVLDRSSISDTGVESAGIRHVLVGGRFVRRDGNNDQNERPGVPILRESA
jgi:N-acyl-D-aspartate/D-glutamate deacylase